jgi:asparagine synthase (glutamine-hydrolysing)
MGDAIRHRGPDDTDTFVENEVGLCHRRLSIIDLSETGRQPMESASGRFVMVYNGEIYNFPVLREELEADGVRFRGTSDSEVVLALYEREGEACLSRLNGMFALAIWDRHDRSLFLARDRLGKKPLYYYNAGGRFVFASEIKAILCDPAVDRNVRDDAVADYFAYQYVPDPKSIFENIHKLPPGHWMRVRGSDVKISQYWTLDFTRAARESNSEQIQHQLLELVEDSVACRMISDVPLGAFLSGGVDSSAVVAMMARNSSKPVTTCAIGFDSQEFDEVHFARKVATQFSTDHHEFTVRENVADNLLDIAAFFDEPFSDPSFVPSYFVSQLARRQVTVALAGDGGDENFAGYGKYQIDRTENRLRSMVPGVVRRSILPGLSRAMRGSAIDVFRRGGSLMQSLSVEPDRGFFMTNSFFRPGLWGEGLSERFARQIRDYDPADITRQLYREAPADDHLSRLLYTDIKSYLPGDILVKVDRMSMANSLETRAPLLDYRVVEYAASIPSGLKLVGNNGKHIFKKSLEGLLTDETLYRKKMGFSVPLADWLRSEIKEVAEQYLFLSDGGLQHYFNRSTIQSIWSNHQSGSHDFSQELWSMLVFELWWQRYVA